MTSALLDQAAELRELARRRESGPAALPQRRTGSILVCGGKGGVGTTTLAVNIAAALSKTHVVRLSSVAPTDFLRDGPVSNGYEEDEGVRSERKLGEIQDNAHWRPDHPLKNPGINTPGIFGSDEPGFIIADGGNSINPQWRRLALAAELAIVVTTAEPASILGAYGVIKELAAAKVEKIKTFVNQIERPHQAEEVHERLRRTARRMLGIDLEPAGYAFYDTRVRAAAAEWPLRVPPLRMEMSGTWRK
jgi:flagellar biosynthesis protein FlhG